MGEEWKETILRIWEMHQYVKPEFSCTLCRAKVNPPTCQGCPIYYHQPFSVIKWQTGEPKELGIYLVTTSSNIIRTANWVNGHWLINNLPFSTLKVKAWCNLSDIEPYKK